MFLHEELSRAKGVNNVYNVLLSEAYNGGKKNDYMRNVYADDFKKYYEIYKNGTALKYCNTLTQEYHFLNTITLEFDQVNQYSEFLDSVEQNAQQLSTISIFLESESNYDMENILATANAFEKMRGIKIQYYPQKGLVTALNFELTDVITIFAMLLVATVLVRRERDNGLLSLIRSMPAGRLHTAIAKIIALGLSLALILIGLYGTNLLHCNSLYGLGPLTRSIQSVPQLMRSTWKLTIFQYLFCFFVTKWLASFICGIWVMLAMILGKRLITGILGALLFICFNLVIRSIVPATSRLNILKYANLVSILRTNELLGTYRNLYWFDHPISILLVECAAATLFGILSISSFCVLFCRHYFSSSARHPICFFYKRKMPLFTTIARQESYKLFVMQGVAVILLLFGGFQIYTAITTKSYIDVDEIYYRYYIKQVEGPLVQESLDWLTIQQKEFSPIYQLKSAVNSKKITAEEYSMAIQGYSDLQEKMNGFLRVLYKLQDIKQKPRTELVYESGWLKLFDQYDTEDLTATLCISILCSVCFSGLFAMEQQTGMIKVISATPLGRHTNVGTEHFVVFISIFIQPIFPIRNQQISFKACLIYSPIVYCDFGIYAWIQCIEQLRIVQKHSGSIFLICNCIIDICKSKRFGKSIALLKNSIRPNSLNRNGILHRMGNLKHVFLLFEISCKRFDQQYSSFFFRTTFRFCGSPRTFQYRFSD